MTVSVRSRATTLLAGAVLCLSAGCGGGDPASPGRAATAPLLEGRTLPIEYPSLAGRIDALADASDPDFGALVAYVEGHCQRSVPSERYETPSYEPDGQAQFFGAINTRIRDQARAICRGYAFLQMTDGLAPIDVIVNGTQIFLQPRRPGDSPTPFMTIPVITGSDAATAALVAEQYFRLAAADGRGMMRDPSIETNAFRGTFTSAGDERVTAAFLLVSQTTEANQMMVEAADVAARAISAASRARHATDPDPVRAQVRSWRAVHDSRLEIANLFLGVPEELFEPEPTSIADGSALTCAGCAYPVVLSAPRRASEQRAVDLLRATRVDPQQGGSVSVADRLRMAMQSDHPAQFSATMNTSEFLDSIGVTESDLNNAARMLEQSAAVTGVPLVADGSTEPVRVTGTEERVGTSDPTIAFAHSAGTLAADDGDVAPDAAGFPPPDFCERSVIGSRVCTRHDTDEFGERTITIATDAVEEAVGLGPAGDHADIPLIANLCVGAEKGTPADPATDLVRLRLIGVPATTATTAADLAPLYQLWWGEAGYLCARDHRDDVTCEADHRITAVPTLLDYDGYATLEWTIDPAEVPASALNAGGDISGRGFLYVTHRTAAGGQRRGVTGFQLLTGVATGSFTRCTFYPVGPAVEDAVTGALVVNSTYPDQPASYCDGLRARELPLEDVFTEAGVSGDFMEAAFLHYLDRAETAAARAENLGERLIAEQMEMNQMAEASIQRINQICGTTLSAGRISITPPAACDATTPCPTGRPCESGRCRSSALDLVDASADDLASLRRCLGDEAPPSPASLGDVAMCAWVYQRDVCRCDGTSCPPCPVPNEDGDCATSLGTGVPSGATLITTTPLHLVSPDVPSTTSSLSACLALARIRSGPGAWLPSDFDEVRSGPWFSLLAAQQVAQSLSVDRSFGGFVSMTRGGRPWMSTGTVRVNPGGDTPTACAVDPALGPAEATLCATGQRFGSSIRCGWGDCDTHAARLVTGERIFAAAQALHLLSGVAPPVSDEIDMSPVAGDDYSSSPLPSWLSALEPGRMIHRRWPSAGDEPARFGTCLDVTGYGATGLTAVGWPRCAEGTFVAGPHDYIGDEASARAQAVRLWSPRDRQVVDYPELATWRDDAPARPSPMAVTVKGVLDASFYGLPLAQPFVGTVDRAVAPGPGLVSTGDLHDRISPEEAFDALELVCAALEGDVGGCSAEIDDLPTVESMEDLDRLQTQVGCAADRFEAVAERLVFMEIPPVVAQDIAAGRITGTYPAYAGEYGVQVATLRQQMESVVASTRHVASVVRDFAGDLRIARSQERISDLERQMLFLQLVSQISSHISQCLAASTPGVSTSGSVSFNPGAAFTCMDAMLQVVLAYEMTGLRASEMDEELRQARTQISMQFASRLDSLADATRLLSESFAGINGTLARMESLRNEARRELAHSLFLDRDDVGQEWTLGRATRGRHNRTRAQYEEAHRAAVQLAFLARRAIEERIGFNLSAITAPLALVEPPNLWADTVCETTGVNFYDVWSEEADHLPRGIQTVADYVARLRLFLDSYMLDYPFENSTDVVVLSLRDDFLRNVRMDCSSPGHNILRASERVQAGGSPAGWWHLVCDQPGGEYCASVSRSGETVFPSQPTDPDPTTGVAARGTRALGGGAEFEMLITCPVVSGVTDCGGEHVAGGGWAQTIDLTPGEYLLSWYERVAPPEAVEMPGAGEVGCAGATIPHNPVANLQVLPVDPEDPAVTAVSLGYVPASSDRWMDDCRWRRVAVHVTVPGGPAEAARTYELVIRIGNLAETLVSSGTTEATYAMGLAGLQFEPVDDDAVTNPSSPEFALSLYYPTDDDGQWPAAACTDRDGRDLRARFRYTCEAALCPEGIGTSCFTNPDYNPDLRTCYWETEVDINLLDIERGWTIPNGGFSVGNFNYRTDSLAVNIVGTNVRDCSRVPYGTAGCYASGYVPFSLHHTDGWRIRNHDGDPFEMSIFPGAIVSAKALASERYLTNPMSSADRSMLTDYWHGEFRGRPVNGHFVLRIHEVPGLDFSQIEDVQIALGYRYWTRQL